MISVPPLSDPERRLALAYARSDRRGALAAIWALDERLGAAVAQTNNPAAAQMRLVWWHDALKSLRADRPVDSVLVALGEAREIDPEALLPLIDGWERLLEPLPIEPAALSAYAAERGGTLFRIASRLLGGPDEPAQAAGQVWALADLAFRVSDRATADRAIAQARCIAPIAGALPRPLAVLAALARRDIRRGLDRPRRQGAPVRVMRALAAGLTSY